MKLFTQERQYRVAKNCDNKRLLKLVVQWR